MAEPTTIAVAGALVLRPFAASDARPLYELIDRNLDHLREWLAWVDLDHTVEGDHAFGDGEQCQ